MKRMSGETLPELLKLLGHEVRWELLCTCGCACRTAEMSQKVSRFLPVKVDQHV